jgi:CDP-glucose 4,6-dehydratase
MEKKTGSLEDLEIMINKNFWKNKKVLITGHTGFKGSWLSFYLHYLGCDIVGYSLKPKPYHKLFSLLNIKKKISYNIFGNILDKKKLSKIINRHKPEIIFHLASQPFVIDSYIDSLNTINTNTIGTTNILDLLKKNTHVKSLVIVTTDKCYKVKKKGLVFYKENSELGGLDPYSASKACAEILTASYVNSFFNNSKAKITSNISTVRSGNILGGGDWGKYRLIPDIINAYDSNKVIKIRNFNSIRPWIHVLDTLTGYINLAEKNYFSKKFVGAWNFGPLGKKNKKVKDIFHYCLINKFIKKTQIKFINSNYKETKTLMLNNSKARKFLKWNPSLSFLETLKFTFDWYKANKNKKNMEQFSLEQIKKYLTK